jgi:hypothetical protein
MANFAFNGSGEICPFRAIIGHVEDHIRLACHIFERQYKDVFNALQGQILVYI